VKFNVHHPITGVILSAAVPAFGTAKSKDDTREMLLCSKNGAVHRRT
jgi:hypothetical protein